MSNIQYLPTVNNSYTWAHYTIIVLHKDTAQALTTMLHVNKTLTHLISELTFLTQVLTEGMKSKSSKQFSQ